MKQPEYTTKVSTSFLRLAGLAVGGLVLALSIFALPALWTAADQDYPDIAYAFHAITGAFYLASIPFFLALRQALKLLGYVDRKQAFSLATVTSLRAIAYYAMAMSVLLLLCLPFYYVWAQKDDAPGLIIVGLLLSAIPLTVAVFAAVLQRLFAEAVHIKSENDLTV